MWGGGTVFSEQVIDVSLNANNGGTGTVTDCTITPPSTDYEPIGWYIKSYTTENFFSSCIATMMKYNGAWIIRYKNVNALANARFVGTIRIAWVKK
jgi:hypothetical protein